MQSLPSGGIEFLITRQDHPDLLIWDVLEPPLEIFVHSIADPLPLLRRLPDAGLAVVGTRTPQPRSTSLIRSELPQLAGHDLVILSGFARGIDAAAHRVAVENGIPTVAVLAGGLDIPYPRENSELREQILREGGILVSEFPRGTEPRPQHFLRRNRLIAGWAKATWVVEAGNPSGALNTAKWARDQDRALFATPCYPGDRALSGNRSLLDEHHALQFWGIHSLGACWLNLAASPRKLRTPSTTGLSAEAAELFTEVRQATSEHGGAHVPELLDWAISRNWEPEKFFLALSQLTFAHRVEEAGGVLISR